MLKKASGSPVAQAFQPTQNLKTWFFNKRFFNNYFMDFFSLNLIKYTS
jgi:hypothetical protein